MSNNNKNKAPVERGKKPQMTHEHAFKAFLKGDLKGNYDWSYDGGTEEWNALAKRLKRAIDDAELLLKTEVTPTQREALQTALEKVKRFAKIGLPIGNKTKMSQLKELEELLTTESFKRRGSVAAYQPHPKKQCVLKL